LQIEGDYFSSLLILGDIDHIKNPQEILASLVKIKNSICEDIDNYHYNKTNKKYFLDTNQLFSILCFLLCKLKAKLL
jgi:hypothetical protein